MHSNHPVSSSMLPPVESIAFIAPKLSTPSLKPIVVAGKAKVDPECIDLPISKLVRQSSRSSSSADLLSPCTLKTSGGNDGRAPLHHYDKRSNTSSERTPRRSDSSCEHNSPRNPSYERSPRIRIRRTKIATFADTTPQTHKRMPPRYKSEGSTAAALNIRCATSPFRRSNKLVGVSEERAVTSKVPTLRRRHSQSSRCSTFSDLSSPSSSPAGWDDYGMENLKYSATTLPNTDVVQAATTQTEITTWKCTCGYTSEGRMKFCGLCGTKRHWSCKGCHFNENDCNFCFCGMCGDSRTTATTAATI